jgi:hypothetical protein
MPSVVGSQQCSPLVQLMVFRPESKAVLNGQ